MPIPICWHSTRLRGRAVATNGPKQGGRKALNMVHAGLGVTVSLDHCLPLQ